MANNANYWLIRIDELRIKAQRKLMCLDKSIEQGVDLECDWEAANKADLALDLLEEAEYSVWDDSVHTTHCIFRAAKLLKP